MGSLTGGAKFRRLHCDVAQNEALGVWRFDIVGCRTIMQACCAVRRGFSG
jgi:hypothetical protein